jgi:hypothetical protein
MDEIDRLDRRKSEHQLGKWDLVTKMKVPNADLLYMYTITYT